MDPANRNKATIHSIRIYLSTTFWTSASHLSVQPVVLVVFPYRKLWKCTMILNMQLHLATVTCRAEHQ